MSVAERLETATRTLPRHSAPLLHGAALFRVTALSMAIAGPGASARADEGPKGAVRCLNPGRAVTLIPATDEPVSREGQSGHCVALTLPVSIEIVRWVGWLPLSPLPQDVLIVEGSGRQGAFEPSSVRVQKADATRPRPASLAIGTTLLGGLAPIPFGEEERVRLSHGEGGTVTLTCRAGNKPAGLVLDPGEHHPPAGARLVARWMTSGDTGFAGGVAARGGSPAMTVPLASAGVVDAPVAPGAGITEAPWFVMVCPDRDATLRLRDLRLEPEPGGRSGGLRSAWAWKLSSWRDEGEQLLERARSVGLTELLVTVAVQDGAITDAERLAWFVARSRQAGVAVVVVEGDPEMALDAGRAHALRRLAALAEYQRLAEPASRLAGLQYDIEPYLLPAFTQNPAGVLDGWGETITTLARAAPFDLDMVVPFWLADHEGAAASVLPALKAAAKSITVMAYRTDLPAIQAAAEPFLAWSAEANVPARIALEAGPLEDETSRFYEPSTEGDLWVLPQDRGALVLLLKHPRADAPGRAYALRRETAAAADRVSSLGDTARMASVGARSAEVLRAWPSFAGLAFHGLVE